MDGLGGLFIGHGRAVGRDGMKGIMAACDIGDGCRERFDCVLRRLDSMPHSMSVYCQCGRIMDLDRQEMELKIILGKILECSTCRNERIGREINLLDSLFAGDTEGGEPAEIGSRSHFFPTSVQGHWL